VREVLTSSDWRESRIRSDEVMASLEKAAEEVSKKLPKSPL
jgi:hypothetical protein